jgi:RimJ/RimL family protein N-acetyltransferase
MHHGKSVYEMGWFVLPAYHGRGIAPRATRIAIANLRVVAQRRFVHAFPPVANAPSNAVCAKVGFSRIGELDFEYPKGNFLRCNDWRLDLQETQLS